jgi:hypothetical protein
MTYYLIGKGEPTLEDSSTVISTDQISANIDEENRNNLNSGISGCSATQLLASSVE